MSWKVGFIILSVAFAGLLAYVIYTLLKPQEGCPTSPDTQFLMMKPPEYVALSEDYKCFDWPNQQINFTSPEAAQTWYAVPYAMYDDTFMIDTNNALKYTYDPDSHELLPEDSDVPKLFVEFGEDGESDRLRMGDRVTNWGTIYAGYYGEKGYNFHGKDDQLNDPSFLLFPESCLSS